MKPGGRGLALAFALFCLVGGHVQAQGGGAITPGGGGVPSIAGTANQINQSGSPGATTLSLSSTVVAPGTLTIPSSGLVLNGSGSGSSIVNAPATGGGTATLPAGSGTLAYSSSIPVSANPSATIGLTAVNGSAASFMTSDSAPLLSQAIAPTWTGIHIYAPTAAASPTALSWAAQSVLGGTSNTAGASWTFKASQGTGTGVGGSLIFQVAPAGTTGSSQNALATALTIDGTKAASFTGPLYSASVYPNVSFGNSSGNGMSFQTSGSTYFFRSSFAEFAINSNGVVVGQNSPSYYGFSSTGADSAPDTFIFRRAAAGVQFGAVDAASPIAQTLSVQSVVAGTANTSGANWIFAGSSSTGSGFGGAEIFQTSKAIAASTTQNAQQEVMRLDGNQHVSFSNTGAPTVSACGTSPAIDAHASDTSGTVTVGTVAAASCTITFKIAYATWNHCSVASQGLVTSFAYSYSLSAITVTGTSLVGDLVDYRCDGQ